MNAQKGIHGAATSACSQNKNRKDRNTGEGVELAEESLCLRLVAPQGIKTSSEGAAASFSGGSPHFDSAVTRLILETV